MIKTDENSNISAESQPICTKPSEQGSFFQAGQNESKEWYTMIKTDGNLNISAESQLILTEPFWGGTSNFGHAKSSIKIFARFSTFHLGGGYVELWSCKIFH